MTFTYDGADLSKVIECIYCDGNNFNIYYLDGSKSTYVCSSEDEKEKIKELMIKQAEERLRKFDIDYLFLKNKIALCCVMGLSIGLAIPVVLSATIEKKLSFNVQEIFVLILICLAMGDFLKTNSKIKELKKYKMFLELLDKLDEINLQFEENDLPLGIDTLDEFSYGEVKSWYKYYKQKNKKKLII